MWREAVQDEAQAEIEGFIMRHKETHNVRLARNARRDIIRRICVNYPHAGAEAVAAIFNEEVESISGQGYLTPSELTWLTHLKAA